MLNWFLRTPFEKLYGLKTVCWFESIGWGLQLCFRPWRWVPGKFWGHPENDVISYWIGPFVVIWDGRSYDDLYL